MSPAQNPDHNGPRDALAHASMVIFDFDGVVADSEEISLGTLRTALAHDGIVRSPDQVRDAFLGKSLSAICTYVATHADATVADGFAKRWESMLFAALRDNLAPIAGIDRLLDHLIQTGTPYCVASSGTFERIGIALDAMGLTNRFPHIFSAEQVARGKPAPDLFLHAARQMQQDPGACLVIEDSPYGVRAAKSANMSCIGFVGGRHLNGIADRHSSHLTAQGADWVVASYAALLPQGPEPGSTTAISERGRREGTITTMTFLGIDLGTSGLRALLVDADGAAIGSAERSYSSTHAHSGWSEQDPADWVEALDAAVADLRATHPEFAALKAAGVAGHMHGATLLDKDGTVIRPCILWNDTRAFKEAQALDAIAGMRETSGNIVFPGFTAPKLAWVKTHEPENFRRTAKVLLPAAYLNYYLTGDYVADMSDSAGTSWLDVGQRRWSPALLEATDLDESHMPRLVEGCQPAGTLRPDLARRWGVGPDVVIAGGAGDNAAAAAGIGALNEGDGFLSLGTSGVLLAARDGYHPAPSSALHTFCHAVPDRWYQMGVMLAATDSLNWLGQITGKAPADLTQALGDTISPPRTVQFFPYLSGERTPHNDANIRGSFTGLGKDATQADLTRAVLEGVAFGLRDSFEALMQTGARIDRILAIGGGAQSRYWVKLIATVLNVPLELPKSGEFGAALGAARLAMLAQMDCAPEAILVAPEIGETILPEADLVAQFDTAYAAFRAAYPHLQNISHT